MTLLEKINSTLVAVWLKIKAVFGYLGQKMRLRAWFKTTRAYAKLQEMNPLRRRMIIMFVTWPYFWFQPV